MKYYFQLLTLRYQRIIRQTGLPLLLFVVFALVVYCFACHAVQKFSYAPYVLIIIVIFILESANKRDRVENLKILFVDRKKYFQVRTLENVIFIFPILLLATISGIYWTLPIMIAISIFYAVIKSTCLFTSNTAIPTPFGKYPFEMIRYFRIYLLANCIAIFLFGIGIIVSNENLAIFGIALIPFFTINHLENVEPLEVLWNYSMKPSRFLFHKIKRITLQTYVMISPLSAVLVIREYSNQVLLLVGSIYLLTFLFIMLYQFMKYSVFPRKIGLFEGIIFALSGLFPPIILGLFPYFYTKAIKNLNEYL